MTDRRARDLRRLLEAQAEPYGAAVAIEPGGKHLRCTFSVGHQRAFITVSRSPSDPNAHRHVRADARRALRALTTSEVML
jgi:hypothetical protein